MDFFEDWDAESKASADGSIRLHVCEDDTIVLSSLHAKSKQTLVFDMDTGKFRVEPKYDEFSIAASKTIRTRQFFGVLGYYVAPFARYLVILTERKLVGKLNSKHSIFQVTNGEIITFKLTPFTTLAEDDHENAFMEAMNTLLTSGLLYYSNDYDITNSLQRSTQHPNNNNVFNNADTRFLFNHFLLKPFLTHHTELDLNSKFHEFLVPVVCGAVNMITLDVDDQEVQFSVIHRTSRHQAGIRSAKRGVNDEGHVANFVEMETIVISEGYISSFVQVSGSVPLKWREKCPQFGCLREPPELELKDGLSASSVSAMKRHFQDLMDTYGNEITVIDMLGDSSVSEKMLSDFYSRALWDSKLDGVTYIRSRGPLMKTQDDFKEFRQDLQSILIRNGYFIIRNDEDEGFNVDKTLPLKLQNGVVRINDLDCVDETSLLEFFIAKEVMIHQLKDIKLWPKSVRNPHFDNLALKQIGSLMALGADSISKQYTGLPTLYGNHMRSGMPLVDPRLLTSPYWRIYVIWGRIYLNSIPIRRQNRWNLLLGENVKQFYAYEDNFQTWYIACLLFLKNSLAPSNINSMFDWVCGVIWVFIIRAVTSMNGKRA